MAILRDRLRAVFSASSDLADTGRTSLNISIFSLPLFMPLKEPDWFMVSLLPFSYDV
jgi:hypothetical protein